MLEIKVKPKGTIKKLDKNVVQVQKFKSNLVRTKEKINEFTSNEENNSAENYASNKIQNDINYISRKGISKTNEIGRKSLKETYDNIKNEKQKINTIKSRIKNKDINELKNVINKTNKPIKSGTKQSIKTAKNTKALTKKGIKTTEQVAKNSKIVAKESLKTTQRAIRISKKIIQATVKATKVAIKATTQVIKAIAQAIKGIVAAIVAGGWVAVIIIIVIVLISGLIAAIFYGTGDYEYEFSQIPSSQILLVAKAQLGNEGGDKFWKWYGFTEHVHWCACYVSYCANECGYIEKGIMPKFALCTDGIKWFKEREQWHDRSDGYFPMIADIIFFDWKDENGNQDGNCDHVGIVTRTDMANRTIYTIEGNTSNKCAERMYSFDDVQVIGYGSPKYE